MTDQPTNPSPAPNPVDDLRKAFTRDYAATFVREGLSLDRTAKVPFIHHLTWLAFRAGHNHATKTKTQ